MPLYLVRWANLSAALVNARDEDDLVDRLDEVGDPTGAKWKVYRGPLHIEIELPIGLKVTAAAGRARSLEDLKITDCPDELATDSIAIEIANSDTGSEMLDEIWAFAFPNLFRAFEKNEWSLSKEEASTAAKLDLDVLVRAHWQIDQMERSRDPDAQLGRLMRTSLRQIKSVLKKPTTGARAPVKSLPHVGGKRSRRAGKPPKSK